MNAKKAASEATRAGSNLQRTAESITGKRYSRAMTCVESIARSKFSAAVVTATAARVNRKSVRRYLKAKDMR